MKNCICEKMKSQVQWPALSCLFALMVVPGFSWGEAEYVPPILQAPAETPSIHFPLTADQSWFVKPSYLVLKPHQDGTEIGLLASSVSNSSQGGKVKTENLDFSWGQGARLGIGRYLPQHQQWDVTLFTTFFYEEADKTARGEPISDGSSLKFIRVNWGSILFGIVDLARASWQMNYFLWDLSVGRNYLLTKNLVLHPFFGLRTALIYEQYSLRMMGSYELSNGSTDFDIRLPTRFKAFNEFWGIGPRLGTDYAFSFGAGWSILGNLSASLLLSRYEIKEKMHGFREAFAPPDLTVAVPIDAKVKDANTLLRSNLEASIGLGWEKWVRNHTVRIAPSFLFETSYWFGINQWRGLNISIPTDPVARDVFSTSSRPKNRDLSLMGFSINLQIDY